MTNGRDWDTRMAAGSALSLPAWQLMLKRWFDVVFATVLLLLLSPLLLAVAVVIRLHSPGPALFLQYRCGLGDRTFRMLKFRTMVVNQANVMDAAYVASLEGSGVLLKIKDDPRVTSVGKWLRRMSIDELPQLVNVMRGEMSIVGPRPLIPFMLNAAPEYLHERSLMRPGLTGLWQVRARAKNTSVFDMIEWDLKYIREFTLWLDLRILLSTFKAVIQGQGAH